MHLIMKWLSVGQESYNRLPICPFLKSEHKRSWLSGTNAPGSVHIPAGGSCLTVEVQIRHRWYENENVSPCRSVIHVHVRIQRGGQGSGPPLKNHKNIGFLGNTGLDRLKNHKATKPAFNHGWANIGTPAKRHWNDDCPLMLVFGSFLSLSTKKKKKMSKLDPLWQNFLDPRRHVLALASLHFYTDSPESSLFTHLKQKMSPFKTMQLYLISFNAW